MFVGIAFAVLVISAGYAALRLLGLAKGATAAGLAPGAGLALTAILTTWCGVLGASPPLAGAVMLACSLAGLGLAVADRDWLRNSLLAAIRDHRLAATLLGAALLVPFVSIGVAFAQVQAPLSPHDGAFHVETSDAFRLATGVSNWYPPGLAALFGAVLQVAPWVDTAAGAYALGVGLTLLAPLAVFGLGVAVWRNLMAASVGALLISLTHLFPYYPQIWSGWPQLLGILLVIGLWLVAVGYAEQPGWRWAIMAGALVGAIVLVHGTELYTSAIVLLVVLVANWRRLRWRGLAPHALGAVVLAVVCVAPYLPVLLHWAGGGGAYGVGYEDGTLLEGGPTAGALQALVLVTVDALGVDLPIRVALVALGLVWALRSRVGLTVVATTLIFIGLATIASLFNGVPLVRTIFAATYPWSLPWRHLTFASVGLALIGGAGGVWLIQGWGSFRARLPGVRPKRLAFRLGRLLVITWVIVSTCLLTLLLSIEAGGDVSFTADDAAAMTWMREHVQPGEVVVNDTFADAGIWAPYKAGVAILFYRSVADPATADERQLVLQNVARLDQVPEAAAAACELHARYVFYGAANAGWQVRTFPPIEELRRSTALEEVFNSGKSSVFRTTLNCADDANPVAG
jgi:hypothetical protein